MRRMGRMRAAGFVTLPPVSGGSTGLGLCRYPFYEKYKSPIIVIQIFWHPERDEARRLEARVLEYFLRVVELGSINRAAAELRLSQPSLSRWLSLLEHEIGTPLLIRTRRGIQVTDAGALLVERSRPILRQLDLLRDEIGQKAHAQLALGMPLSMQRVVTVPFVEHVSGDHPNVTLRVYEGINNALRKWMEDGLLDVGMMVTLERMPEHFEMTPLVRERMILVGDKRSGLRMDEAAPLSRLGAAHMIMPGRPNVIRSYVEGAVRRAGYDYQSRIEAETLSLCLELTRRGLGYTVMPYCTLHGRLEGDAELTAAPIDGISLTWGLCVNRARAHSIVVRAVTAALRSFIAARIASGEWPLTEFIGR
jgi:LysR family nitrogen assimilation transcriptional regulator